MRGSRQSIALLIVILATILLSIPSTIPAGTYIEDFTTTTYRDAANTTADWNTSVGTLQLHAHDPIIVGSLATVRAWDVEVDGNLAYVADFLGGLQVIDITNPASPVLLGTYDSSGQALRLSIQGNLVFLADDGAGLRVIDVSNPANPSPIGQWDPSDAVWDVAVSGDLAYVANRGQGLRVIDVGIPTSPTMVGELALTGSINSVCVEGQYAYVTSIWTTVGLYVVDIGDPTAPVLVASRETPGNPRSVKVSGNHLYLSDNGTGLLVYDVANPANPILVGTYATTESQGVDVRGDRAYLCGRGLGLRTLDISDPTNPTLIHTAITPDTAEQVAVAGIHAFVADAYSGLQVVEVAAPMSPRSLATAATVERALRLEVAGDYAYVTQYPPRLGIFDISDPSLPVRVATLSTTDHLYELAVAGDFLYLANQWSGITTIDISDPAVPVVAGSMTTSTSFEGITVAGDLAYISDYIGLKVYDISTPASPVLVGELGTTGWAHSCAVAGNRLYQAMGNQGIVVIDITDPTNPALVGSVDTYNAMAVCVAGDHAYVADGQEGLKVIDVTNPASPVIVGTQDTNFETVGISVDGDRAYMANDAAGLLVIDISDPASPVIIGQVYAPQDDVRNVRVVGVHAFLASGNAGLQVVKLASSRFDPTRDRARSATVAFGGPQISRCRISSTQSDAVNWLVTADGGSSWTGLLSNAGWYRLDFTGTDLRWYAELRIDNDQFGPSCSQLRLDWLLEPPRIKAIDDIPGDQGGRVMIEFERSGYDFADETNWPIMTYNIWRRVDDPDLRGAVLNDGQPVPGDGGTGALPRTQWRDQCYAIGSAGRETSTLPPGVWAALGSFAAAQRDDYLYEATTVADSTTEGIAWSVYCVTAHATTPSVWFAGEVDSSYSIDNLAPSAPENLRLETATLLAWDESSAADFDYFTVCGSDNDILDATAAVIGYTTGLDMAIAGETHRYYFLTATDFAGNESEAAVLDALSGVDGDVPVSYSLHFCVPNPFNPQTTIAFDLPSETAVSLRVYDMTGRLVDVLLNDEIAQQGRNEVVWRGRDQAGLTLPSGTYFYRLEAGGYSETKRMTLLK